MEPADWGQPTEWARGGSAAGYNIMKYNKHMV